MESLADKFRDGHVFKPALQDISLKRFRMRYSTYSDCYYLHWDKAICQALGRIQGLESGVYGLRGIQLTRDKNDMAYLTTNQTLRLPEIQHNGIDDGSTLPPSTVSWQLDFSDCGLVVKSILIKARCQVSLDNDSQVTFSVEGDREIGIKRTIDTGDYLKEVPFLRGSKTVCLTAQFRHHDNEATPPRFLANYANDDECPLDIIVNLMCPQPDSQSFVGEILLGLKYSPTGASESLRDKSDITIDCGLMGGQLQVHLFEGAGLTRENSKKTPNSLLKCSFLPDPNGITCQQTSPKQSAYPTWAKEFIYAGVDLFDISQGGLEILLYNHHLFFSNDVVGGVRLCIPQKRLTDTLQQRHKSLSGSLGCLISPSNSRSSSPFPFLANPGGSSSSQEYIGTPTLMLDLVSDDFNGSSFSDVELPAVLTTVNGRPASFNGLPSASSPMASPVTRRVPIFSLPRSRDSPILSPRASPSFGRRHLKSPKLSPKPLGSRRQKSNTEFLYDWMDSVGNEVSHWQRIMDTPGEWIYCWHVLRPNITPAIEL